MATEFQVTFDSADPGAHAAFWAEAVHYVQPPPPPGFDSWDAALDAWGVPADHRNDRAALVDPDEPEEGGEPVCWAHLVCPDCGAMESEGHRPGCGSA